MKYLILSIILITLSIGIFVLYQKNNQQLLTNVVKPTTQDSTPAQETPILPYQPAPTFEDTSEASDPTPYLSPKPTPTYKTYQSSPSNFKVVYRSFRTVTQDNNNGDNRHIFSSPSSTITVHAGTNWVWENTERVISPKFLVASQEAYVYSQPDQKLVDFKKDGLFYTIQCIHQGNTQAITECDQFVRDFKFLR